MAVNQYERAYRAWPILTARASARQTITYGEAPPTTWTFT